MSKTFISELEPAGLTAEYPCPTAQVIHEQLGEQHELTR